MPFLVEVYSRYRFVGDFLAYSVKDAKCKASKMCNDNYSSIDTMKITSGEHHGVVFIRRNKIQKVNNKIKIKHGQWT